MELSTLFFTINLEFFLILLYNEGSRGLELNDRRRRELFPLKIMQIKLSTLKSSLRHSNTFTEENQIFLQEIEAKLESKLNITPLEDYDCDLKLIFIQTGGSEGLFLKNLDTIKEPVYLLTSGGNNSLAASLEIMTYLRMKGIKGEVLHGSSKYLAKRISLLAKIGHAKKEACMARLGVLGKPSDWLIASVVSDKELKERFGISLVDIPLSRLEKAVSEISFLPSTAYTDKKFNLDEVKRAEAVYNAMHQIAKEENLSGLTIRCFDLLTSIKRTGCLGLAKLNDEGIIGTCEGDIMAMVSMYLVRVLTGKESFQANPSQIDIENREITFAHCTIPFKMVDKYHFDTHFESGIGVAIKGEMREDTITIFRLSADLKSYFLMTGKIITNLDEANLCRTQIRVKMDNDIECLLTNPCGNHHIICYGDEAEVIKAYLDSII